MGLTQYSLLGGAAIVFFNVFFVHYLHFYTGLWLLLLLPALAYVYAVTVNNKIQNHKVIQQLSIFIYVVFPFVSMFFLVFPNNVFNGILLFVVFIFIWTNDSFAYVFGVSLGKHRIWPSVSPKKSWEGSIGGLTMVLLLCSVLWYYQVYALSLFQWFGFGLVVVVSATLGDFFESHLKRRAHVKDSGKIMPGHGGFLDRFDSTLFAVPTSVLYLQLIHII